MDQQTNVFYALVGGAALKAISLLWIGSRQRKEQVGHVSSLYVYPVKSVRELKGLTTVMLTRHGVKYQGFGDRHWMVTKNGDMWTMRQNPRLTLISSTIQGDSLCLNGPDVQPLLIPLYPEIKESSLATVTVKKTPLPSLDCGDEAAKWVCQVLKEDGLRLNYSAPSLGKRLSNTVQKGWPTEIQPHDEVAFQDFVQCMIMCESSMQALNKRLDDPVTCINFRPNIMIEGTTAFDEDNWQEVFFGEKAHVRYVDKCTRCIVTTIDPDTAEKCKDEQPLKELKKFRCMDPYGPKPCMGIHTSVEVEGEVKVGDPVYVIRKR